MAGNKEFLDLIRELKVTVNGVQSAKKDPNITIIDREIPKKKP